jgi:hypothetical protein
MPGNWICSVKERYLSRRSGEHWLQATWERLLDILVEVDWAHLLGGSRVVWPLLTIALLLRLFGVGYGFPDRLLEDEHTIALRALRMLMTGDFRSERNSQMCV